MNDKPFSFISRNGSHFTCKRCDFKGDIKVKTSVKKEFFALDVAEMIGYHATNIWPELNGFSGYDTIRFDYAP